MRRVILLIGLISMGIIFSLFANSYAASTKEEYELRERCNKRAEERFKSEYGDGLVRYNSQLHAVTDYTTHYNRKLNKCFVLLSAVFLTDDKKRNVLKRFVDINENIELGTFENLSSLDRKITCFVFDKECYSETEWNSLVKSYMED
jgi:hypothetical protein